MTAFVAFLRTYSVWLYLLCALGIIIGIKILVDARRLARLTLFSLEQERAGEQTFRALALIFFMFVGATAVTIANAVLPQVVPIEEAVILRASTPTISALIFPTTTSVPSVTPTFKATETPFLTSTPPPATAARTVAVVKPTGAPATSTATPAFALPAPVLDPKGPVWNGVVMIGMNQATVNLRFQWIWDCAQCRLGPDDRFVVMISYIDKDTGGVKTIGGGTQANYLTMAEIMRGGGIEVWHHAKDDAYKWSVQVKRGEVPLTPPSATWSFVWH